MLMDIMSLQSRPGAILNAQQETTEGTLSRKNSNTKSSSVWYLTSHKMNALLIFMGLVYTEHLVVSGSVVDVRVQLGEDVMLYCDCTTASGVLVMWYRNCSHMYQPTLVLKLRTKYLHDLRNDPLSWMIPLPRFQFVKNDSSNSYDLLISNVTESDEGLYYCGTETVTLEEDGTSYLQKKYKYGYGNVSTQLTLISESSEVLVSHKTPLSHHDPVWRAILVPGAVVLFCNVCFILLYHLCQKHDARLHTRGLQDKDLCLTTVVFGAMERKIQ
ncbi:uncharacterized protein LOC110172603 isoform X2 [Boleophthalmus pectinirostris]|uniref:uncharacterized protein LOC110172603 isoform X2 n=1 Tax=Boleophthalmus pectinirostris TaxID=150288 RepID=UPI00242ED9E4|nr:uncharacterized protein LOC110172603 isoform X2 [Boleophthalmus pectinirostris]